jgi:hypothetical protein
MNDVEPMLRSSLDHPSPKNVSRECHLAGSPSLAAEWLGFFIIPRAHKAPIPNVSPVGWRLRVNDALPHRGVGEIPPDSRHRNITVEPLRMRTVMTITRPQPHTLSMPRSKDSPSAELSPPLVSVGRAIQT